MMVSPTSRRPFTGCRSLRTDALRGKEIGIDCGSHGITQALLHAMRASIEFARARVLQASQRMTAVTPFAIGAHGRSCGAGTRCRPASVALLRGPAGPNAAEP